MLDQAQVSPRLARITIYPIKSFDGISIPCSRIAPPGGLINDRRWKLMDGDGVIINAKRRSKIHLLRASFDLDAISVTLTDSSTSNRSTFHLPTEIAAASDWLSGFFDTNVSILENLEGGFPDDRTRPGPTLISTATIERVSEWFGGLDCDEVRRRFRANLEIDGVPAFWEDSLFREDEAEGGERFEIGGIVFEGLNPCKRCIVPTRDSRTACDFSNFATEFMQKRIASLPKWSAANRFDDFAFRLATNTRILDYGGGMLASGESVNVL